MKPFATAPLALLLVAGSASAEPAGHYDPEAVTAASSLFRMAAAGSQGSVEPLERSLVRTDGALARLELALGLLKGSVDGPQHELWAAKLEARSTQFFAEAESFQRETYAIGDAFQTAFGTALERALAGAGVELVECREPKKSALGSLAPPPGLGGGKEPAAEKQCPGEDYSPRLAAAWDADAELQAAVRKLSEPPATTVTTYDERTPPLALAGGPVGATWLDPADLASQLPEAQELLDRFEAEAEAARDALIEGKGRVEAAADPDALRKAIVARARGIRAWTDDQRAALGAALWDATAKARKKARKDGWSDVAACANPAVWSACEGTDVTDRVAEALLKDKKLQKTLAKMLEELDGPETGLPE